MHHSHFQESRIERIKLALMLRVACEILKGNNNNNNNRIQISNMINISEFHFKKSGGNKTHLFGNIDSE